MFIYGYTIINQFFFFFLANPKLLEDRLWQKDLSVKDYYKIEECHSVHIGSFKTVPAPSGDMLVCLHGIRMTVKGLGEFILIILLIINCFNFLATFLNYCVTRKNKL